MEYSLAVVIVGAAAAIALELLKRHSAWLKEQRWILRAVVLVVCAVEAYMVDAADGTVTANSFAQLLIQGVTAAELSYQWVVKHVTKLKK